MAVDKSQIEIAERLQNLILEDFEDLLTNRKEDLTATDRATIVRFLQANGWTVDPASLPANLKGMLTAKLPVDDEETPELAIVR